MLATGASSWTSCYPRLISSWYRRVEARKFEFAFFLVLQICADLEKIQILSILAPPPSLLLLVCCVLCVLCTVSSEQSFGHEFVVAILERVATPQASTPIRWQSRRSRFSWVSIVVLSRAGRGASASAAQQSKQAV